MAQDKRRFADVRDDIGNGKSLSRTGNAQQHLRRLTLFNAFGKLSDSLWLVARRFVF